jgi:hypothetical protein
MRATGEEGILGAIPRCIEDITPEYLTGALRTRGLIRDAAVTGCQCESIGVGVGFLGQLARIRLDYDRDERRAPRTLIAKMPTVDPGGREICRLFRFYEREIRFYDDVAPNVEMRVPERYFSAMDVDADDYLLFLEDITDARIGDEVAGCTAAEAEMAVRSIAEFHAKWWNSPKLDALDWMPRINGPVNQSAEPAYNDALEPFLELFGNRLSPAMRSITQDMRTHVVDLLDALEPAPRTIAHGDFRLDNIFFSKAGGSSPIAVIDWQISNRGRGVFDVAYFLSSCVEPEVRRAEEQRLMRMWHEIAARGHSGYSFDDAWTDYRRAVLFCNVYTVIAIGTLDMANERGSALFQAWLRRRNTAIEDLEAGRLMPA